ncbi:unnamed protein product [Ranitomeya imitator]|uniref:Uncharacterized protein n=1 Tax=Ranitomeya imitator TaxID=111125 RepID=A0ABN9L1N7_9NEOB|nr:unnamed protein product [Ranitomeya imitator]
MTLAELSLQTSSESWTPSILNEACKVIYKLVRLDCFSTYWNVNSTMYYHQPCEKILFMILVDLLVLISALHVDLRMFYDMLGYCY